jgi:ABC-type Zn2+ transport system substrate-binding protein/surface adhesin
MNMNSSSNFPSIVPNSEVPEKGEKGKESIYATGTSATINQANKEEETKEKNHTNDADEDTKIQEDSGGRSKIEGSHSNNNKINSEEDYVYDDHNNINLWQKPLNSWFDIYNEVSRNTARITEHWLKLFWNPWAANRK